MKINYLLLNAYGMGGTIRTVINQANAMAAGGHDVQITSVRRTAADSYFPIDGRVRVLPLTGVDDSADDAGSEPGTEVPRNEARKHIFTRRVEQAVVEFLGGVDADVMVTTRPALNLLTARYADPRMVRVGQEHLHLGRYSGEISAAIKSEYPRLNAIVTLTYRDRDAYRRAFAGSVRVERIPNPLHTLDVPHTDHTAKVIATAGRLTSAKGFDLLLQAFEKVIAVHPDWKLCIYGAGRRQKSLRKIIHRRHLYNHAFLMGASRHLDDELARAGIYALSSRFEGFGMVLLEAMNCGLPVVAFDCPVGPAELVEHDYNGMLVPPEDTNALAAALCRLIEDPAMRRRLGDSGLVTAHAYSPESIRTEWEALFSDLS